MEVDKLDLRETELRPSVWCCHSWAKYTGVGRTRQIKVLCELARNWILVVQYISRTDKIAKDIIM